MTIAANAAHRPPGTSIPVGSKIYIDSNNGFEIFILAAFQAKGVNVVRSSTRESADFILDSTLFHDSQFSSVAGVSGNKAAASSGSYKTSEAAFELKTKGGEIIWAYAATKGMLSRGGGKQSVAEACAKHLKEIVH